MRRPEPLLALLALGACSMAPPYAPPTTAVPPQFRESAPGWADAQPADQAPRGPWWKAFADPVLDDLEGRMEQASPTLGAALARFEAARAAARGDAADLYPTIAAGADVTRERVSGRRPLGDGKPHTYTSSVVGGGLSWEVDLWGRVRNIASAGRAEAEASAGDLASVRLSLQAALADAYFRLRGLDQQALLLEETVEAYARAHDLTVTRHDGGIGSGIDVNRSQTLLSNARAQLADVRLQRAQTEHEIAALVGELASAFAVAPSVRPLVPPAVAPLVPAQLLERRPDVAAAERRMAAANARIGAARAAFFPTVSIDAAGGYQTAGGKLFDSPASYWALGPLAAVLPLFDGGRRKAAVEVARADHAGTAAYYRDTVLAAFREVEDALAAVRTLGDRWTEQRTAAAAADRTRLLALVRYRDGASDYLEVVTAQTASLDASRQVLSIETERMRAAIALIRATGGGLPPQPAAG